MGKETKLNLLLLSVRILSITGHCIKFLLVPLSWAFFLLLLVCVFEILTNGILLNG